MTSLTPKLPGAPVVRPQTHRLGSLLVAAMIPAFVVGSVLLSGCSNDGSADKKAEKSATSDAKADKKTDGKPAAAKPALVVTLIQPQTVTMPSTFAANGNVLPWQEAVIGSEAAGLKLLDVRAQVGDIVKRGQLLAKMADDTVKVDLAQAQAALAEARAALSDAQANAKRAREVQGTGALSQQQIDQLLLAEQTVGARVKAAEAQVQAQQLRLKHTDVLAPDDGVITARQATVGTVPGMGQELFRLLRGQRLEFRAEVTASELKRIHPGLAVRVTPTGGPTLQGKVRTLAPTIDPATRNGLVLIDLPRHEQVRAGMFGKAEFDFGQQQALSLPEQAVTRRDGRTLVFRTESAVTLPKEGDTKASIEVRVREVDLQIGRRHGDRIEILGGLDANAQVVASGGGFLNDGDLVKVTR